MRLDEVYLAVEFETRHGFDWYQKKLPGNKDNLNALLTILKDATGNLNPHNDARTSAFKSDHRRPDRHEGGR